MVILKDPSTGKYYIAPSPPSFYKSYPSKETLKDYGIVKKGGNVTFTKTPRQIAEATIGKTRIENARQEGLRALAKQKVTAKTKAQKQKLKRARLSKEERLSLFGREQLRMGAIARGRGFSRNEVEKFLKQRGGSVSGLRSAKRKGFRLIRENVKIPIVKEKLIKISKNEKIIKKNLIPIKAPFTKGIETAVDIISGGYLTERSIDKKQIIINQDVENFNKKFGGRELTESQFKEANRISKAIETKEENLIKERDKLAKSLRSKVGNILYGQIGARRLTSEERSDLIKSNEPFIEKQKLRIEKINKKILQESKRKEKGAISKFKLKRWKDEIRGANGEIQRLKEGRPAQMYTGELAMAMVGDRKSVV